MLLIKGARIFGGAGDSADILIEGGRIIDISANIDVTERMTVLDAAGLYAAPGLVDMHVHFRDPGFTYKEDIYSGASAAAAGGVTTCCCMPNTSPAADNAEVVSGIAERAKSAPIRVLPYGAVTLGQRGGELTDFAALKAAGAAALSDDGNSIQNAAVMRSALKTAREAGMLIVSHCEDSDLARSFAVNEGKVSRKLGLPGRPAVAEEIMVARDAMLAADTGAAVHIAHVSTAKSVGIIRRAKAAGVRITAETCPQYFTLTEDEVLTQGASARVNPPLRTASDVEAIIEGLIDGTIDVIATDHAPHSTEEKALPLDSAPSGMIGLETSLALTLTYLYRTGRLSAARIAALTSENPARILGIDAGRLQPGARADIVLFDPAAEWVVTPWEFRSKARNTPFAGMRLRGRVRYTIANGIIVYDRK